MRVKNNYHRKDNIFKLYYFFIVLLFVSCSSENDFDNNNIDDNKYHILILGNSFSRDAFHYVPAIMEDVCADFTVDMEILCLNGKALDTHLNYLNNNLNKFVLDKYESHTGRWKSYSGIDGGKVISSSKWDVVILQEGVTTAMDCTKTSPHIKSLTDYISFKNADVKFAYMLNPGGVNGYTVSGRYYTSDEVWELDVKTACQLLEHHDVDYVIPCGTAIQNARHTYLDTLGKKGHLSYDGVHLQEGLPRIIEAYVASQSLFDIYSINASIISCDLQITKQWVDNKNIPWQRGNVITGTDEDYILCKRCAIMALESPYSISKNL